MAYRDYNHCAVCDCKNFYDANSSDGYIEAHQEKRILSLCKTCAETHEIKIITKPLANRGE